MQSNGEFIRRSLRRRMDGFKPECSRSAASQSAAVIPAGRDNLVQRPVSKNGKEGCSCCKAARSASKMLAALCPAGRDNHIQLPGPKNGREAIGARLRPAAMPAALWRRQHFLSTRLRRSSFPWRRTVSTSATPSQASGRARGAADGFVALEEARHEETLGQRRELHPGPIRHSPSSRSCSWDPRHAGRRAAGARSK